jgi:hypothetical protein
MGSKPMRRVIGGVALLFVFFLLSPLLKFDKKEEWQSGWADKLDKLETWTANIPVENYTHLFTSSPKSELSISYDLSVPPKIGCEAVVSSLQLRLIEAYSELLEGVRHVNLWGYLG